jgi:heparan-alpha-glucosaminide N-acetyltransferase
MNENQSAARPASGRITSIDALRGFVMFMMIFVNDLAGAPENLVPDWMVHFSDRHKGGSGMTFVDLVFPAFLFIVGMSIPFALGSRLNKGEPVWKISGHIVVRTLALLALGILMVNGESGGGMAWEAEMFLSGILAFCSFMPRKAGPKEAKYWKIANLCVRALGFAAMLYCALTFTSKRGHHMLTLSPLHLNVSWYGILGLIGWAYLAAAILFLIFRTRRTALLGCVALMTSFFAADKNGFFDNFWPAHFVDFGGTLGSQAAIAVAGLLLATVLVTPDMASVKCRVKFTLLFIAGFAFAAMLLTPVYGISKNEATPAWCLWSCAITAALWLGFYYLCDVKPVKLIARPLSVAGQNVLLAYLISEMQESVFNLLHLGDWYDSLAEPSLVAAIARSVGCAVVILLVTAGLNRIGFRLKL